MAVISHNGISSAYFAAADVDNFGNQLAKIAAGDGQAIKSWCTELKAQADKILKLIKKMETKNIGQKDYADFLSAFYDYAGPHRAVKVCVDYLPPALLKKHLPSLTEARLRAEPVYSETEKLMKIMAKQIGRKEKIPPELILAQTKEEFEKYWQTGKLPLKNILKQRFENTVLLFVGGEYLLVKGKPVLAIEKKIQAISASPKEIRGTCAYPGLVRGMVRIITSPKSKNLFNPKDILVTGMTRPEYMPYIKLCAGYITDAGGILSHAAITARELKKPCVIGTQAATKILKSGELVEMDAKNGVIKIIK